MSNMMKILMAAAAVASIGTSPATNAGEPRGVTCTVTLTYMLNGTVRAPYANVFTVLDGATFEDDFSTATRFRFFTATARPEADKSVTVMISYYNDVGVFEAVDFTTQVRVADDRAPVTNSGSHTYWSSLGVAGDHTTDYSFTCQRVKS